MASLMNTIDFLSSKNKSKRAAAVFTESRQYTGIEPPGPAKKTPSRRSAKRGGGRRLGPITTPLAVR